jgi:hypothetical protein
MSDESTLRKKAREAMQAGKLPSRVPQRMWGGPGIGACCTICGRPAGHHEVEFELEFSRGDDDREPDIHHVHLQCFAAWELERTNFESIRGTVWSSDGALSQTPSASLGEESEITGVSGTLPAPGKNRIIVVHECDGTDKRGSG